MNVRQMIDQLRNYPPKAIVVVRIPTGGGAYTEHPIELVVDASVRGATRTIYEHRAAMVCAPAEGSTQTDVEAERQAIERQVIQQLHADDELGLRAVRLVVSMLVQCAAHLTRGHDEISEVLAAAHKRGWV